MERIYLPKHLLMPFFDEQKIYYKMGNKPEALGWLGLVVFGDGSVSLQLYSQSKEHGAVRGDGQTLASDILDKIFWNGERKAFEGSF